MRFPALILCLVCCRALGASSPLYTTSNKGEIGAVQQQRRIEGEEGDTAVDTTIIDEISGTDADIIDVPGSIIDNIPSDAIEQVPDGVAIPSGPLDIPKDVTDVPALPRGLGIGDLFNSLPSGGDEPSVPAEVPDLQDSLAEFSIPLVTNPLTGGKMMLFPDSNRGEDAAGVIPINVPSNVGETATTTLQDDSGNPYDITVTLLEELGYKVAMPANDGSGMTEILLSEDLKNILIPDSGTVNDATSFESIAVQDAVAILTLAYANANADATTKPPPPGEDATTPPPPSDGDVATTTTPPPPPTTKTTTTTTVAAAVNLPIQESVVEGLQMTLAGVSALSGEELEKWETTTEAHLLNFFSSQDLLYGLSTDITLTGSQLRGRRRRHLESSITLEYSQQVSYRSLSPSIPSQKIVSKPFESPELMDAYVAELNAEGGGLESVTGATFSIEVEPSTTTDPQGADANFNFATQSQLSASNKMTGLGGVVVATVSFLVWM